MTEKILRVRASRSAGELEIEGSPDLVREWWDELWPDVGAESNVPNSAARRSVRSRPSVDGESDLPEIFGEFFHEFRSDSTDVDKVLIAGAFVQGKDDDRTFTTKNANQLLIDQNIKVANASECVRRLLATKRAFVVSDGRFRVSSTGLEHLKALRTTAN